MSRIILKLIAGLGLAATVCAAQTLPAKWEDLTSADFAKAIQQSGGVCLLPMGSVEKWGPSGPLGTDLYLVRLISTEAVKKEYAVVFPPYFTAGTNDMSAMPGAIYLSPRLQYDLLDETTREMARNGCRKILLVNGSSGNNALITLFMAGFAAAPHDYAIYSIYGNGIGPNTMEGTRVAAAEASKPGVDGHGGEDRISAILAYYPDLVHLDRAHDEPGSNGPPHPGDAPAAAPAPRPQTGQTVQGIMNKLPSGYSGDASGATAARGKALVANGVEALVKAIQDVKADNATLKVEKQFYEQRESPDAAK